MGELPLIDGIFSRKSVGVTGHAHRACQSSQWLVTVGSLWHICNPVKMQVKLKKFVYEDDS